MSEKGTQLWAQLHILNSLATNFCSKHDESWCFNKSFCCRRDKHLPFQCDYNDIEILASYAKGNYEFDNLEQIEEFVVFMGAYEITAALKNTNDASYKSENYVILGYCLNYYSDNPHITEFLERTYP